MALWWGKYIIVDPVDRYVKRIKVGNKIDQEEHREVGRHEAERYAEENNCTYFETSAKDSTGINDAFESGIFSLNFYRLFRTIYQKSLHESPKKKIASITQLSTVLTCITCTV